MLLGWPNRQPLSGLVFNPFRQKNIGLITKAQHITVAG